MSKIKIYIKTNVNDDTNDIYKLLKIATQDKYDFYLVDCEQYVEKPSDRPSYTAIFFNYGNFYFEFDTPTIGSKVAEYDKLVEFADQFKEEVTEVIKNSRHQHRLPFDSMNLVAKNINLVTEKTYRDILVNKESGFTYANNSSNKSSTTNFFLTERKYSNTFKAELATGVILGLIALPLFFFEPYTATLLALCAIVLLYSAYDQYQQDNKDNLALNV